MVTLTPNEYMTLSDVMKFKTSDGNPLRLIVDEYMKPLTLGADIPACEASDKLEDNGFFSQPWEYGKVSDTTDLDGGSKFYKTGTYARKDIMGMRSSAIGINRRQYDLAGAAADLWRAEQTFERVKHLALDKEHDMFYGDPTVDPNQGLGLAPRFSVCTDADGLITAGAHQGELSPYVTIDAGGTQNGALGSVYLMYLSSRNGTCWIYPKDSRYTAGILYEKGSWQDHTYEQNGQRYVKKEAADIFEVVGGIAMKSRKSVVRIANIDFSSAEGIAKFDKALYQAFEAIPTEFQNGVKIYTPKRAVASLKNFYRDKMLVNVASYEGAKPMNLRGDFSIDGMLFRKCEQLTLAESKIN